MEITKEGLKDARDRVGIFDMLAIYARRELDLMKEVKRLNDIMSNTKMGSQQKEEVFIGDV